MEFLDVLETFRAGDASVAALFGGEGRRVRNPQPDPQYLTHLNEAVAFVSDIYRGRRPIHQLREALTTSDFPLLFGDIIDRQLLANYRETVPTYRNYVKAGSVADFRNVKRFAVDGSEAILAAVPQQTEYPESKLSDTVYQYAVKKYGRAIPFAWESMINDDLDALKDIPARFGRAARRSEEKFATQLFVLSTGPDTVLYTAGHANIVTGNPVLSIAALQTAFTLLAAQKDTEGEPIAVEAVELVVPPALEVTAMNILNATELWLNAAGGVADQQVHTINWMRNRTRLSVNYYLPIVDTTHGSTSWYLFASESGAGRPVLEMGFLRGHEEPEIWMKEPNAIRIGGGGVNPMDGDFDTDSLRYRIRHVFGGTQEDYRGTVASNGSGA